MLSGGVGFINSERRGRETQPIKQQGRNKESEMIKNADRKGK